MAENINDRLLRSRQELAQATETRVKLENQLKELLEQQDDLSNKTSKRHKKQLTDVQKGLDIATKNLKVARDVEKNENQRYANFKKFAQAYSEQFEGFENFKKSYEKLTPEIKKQLEADTTKGQLFKELNIEAIKARYIADKASGEQKIAAEERATLLENTAEEQLKAAEKVVERQKRGFLTETEYEAKLAKEAILNNKKIADIDKERAIAGMEFTEKLEKKEEVLNELYESRSKLLGALPGDIQTMAAEASEFGSSMMMALTSATPMLAVVTLVVAALGAAIKSFVEMDEAAEDFRKTTGYTADKTHEIEHAAHEIEIEYRKFGVTSAQVLDITNELKNEFSDISQFSKETTAALSLMKNNLGLGASDAAKVQAVFEEVGGLTQNAAANVGMQVADMARLAGVSPKEVLEDIADSAEITSKFFKGDVNVLKQQVIQAHQLGTTLGKVAAISEKLLDFENSIEDELVAATFVGGQFNLNRARALAYENDLIGAQKETLKQLNQGVGFRNQDYFAQQQLAKAAGMSVAEINKQLLIQDKLSKLSGEDLKNAEDAIKANLDISDIKDEDLKKKVEEFAANNKIQGQLTDMKNAFESILATVGGSLMPLISAIGPILALAFKPIEWAAKGFQLIVENIKYAIPVAIALGTIFAEQLGVAIGFAYAKIMATFAEYPFGVGIPLGLAAIGGLATLISSAKATKVGDINSPADGKTMVSTKEGGLYQLSPNDDLIAAPGAASALSNAGNGGNGGGIAVQLLVNEMRQLRKDMSSKSTDVYMDGSKVTANIAGNVNKSTRNNFALGY